MFKQQVACLVHHHAPLSSLASNLFPKNQQTAALCIFTIVKLTLEMNILLGRHVLFCILSIPAHIRSDLWVFPLRTY